MPVPTRAAILAPRVVDRRDLATPVGNQGNEGSCVGWAADGAMRLIRRMRFMHIEQLSARWVYEEAKKIDTWPDVDENGNKQEGTDIRSACAVLRAMGICEYDFYPYFVYNADCMDPKAPEDARTRRITEYVSVQSWREIKDAISRIGAVIGTVKLHMGWIEPKNGIIEYKEGYDLPDVYHHAVSLEGYDDPKSMVLGRNSWGSAWGDNGYFWISLEDFMKHYRGGWTIKL